MGHVGCWLLTVPYIISNSVRARRSNQKVATYDTYSCAKFTTGIGLVQLRERLGTHKRFTLDERFDETSLGPDSCGESHAQWMVDVDGIQVSESPGLLCLSILGRSFPTVVCICICFA